MMQILILLPVFLLLSVASANCGIQRWSVKTGSDNDVSAVNLSPAKTNLTYLRSIPKPDTLPDNNRIMPYEATTFMVDAVIVQYGGEDDSDIHLVVMDILGETIIAEIPDAGCVVNKASSLYNPIVQVQKTFLASYPMTVSFVFLNQRARITGVGFFDKLHGQNGLAPNGIELHPLTNIEFLEPTATDYSITMTKTHSYIIGMQGETVQRTVTLQMLDGNYTAGANTLSLCVGMNVTGMVIWFDENQITFSASTGMKLTTNINVNYGTAEVGDSVYVPIVAVRNGQSKFMGIKVKVNAGTPAPHTDHAHALCSKAVLGIPDAASTSTDPNTHSNGGGADVGASATTIDEAGIGAGIGVAVAVVGILVAAYVSWKYRKLCFKNIGGSSASEEIRVQREIEVLPVAAAGTASATSMNGHVYDVNIAPNALRFASYGAKVTQPTAALHAPPPLPVPRGPASLPLNWELHHDANGVAYYWNRVTNESRWDRPV